MQNHVFPRAVLFPSSGYTVILSARHERDVTSQLAALPENLKLREP